LLPVPPHEQINSNRIIGRPGSKREVRRRFEEPGRMTIPTRATVHSQPECGKELGMRAAVVGAVVVTLTVKVEGMVALTFSLAGSEQFAAVGTPAQVKVAVPLKAPPPMESV
jgi:hypothetical protein